MTRKLLYLLAGGAWLVSGYVVFTTGTTPSPVVFYPIATKADTTWYEVIVTKGMKIDSVKLK